MALHRKCRNAGDKKQLKLYQKINELGVEHFYIELLTEVNDIENIEQLQKTEGEYIRQFGTLNMKVEGRNHTE